MVRIYTILGSACFLQSFHGVAAEKETGIMDDLFGGKKAVDSCFQPEPERDRNGTSILHWKPPSEGWLKLNVDASFITQTGDTSWGAVLRDHRGLSAWGKSMQCQDTSTAEALACLAGIRACVVHAHLPIILASDCSRVIQALADTRMNRSTMAPAIFDIRDLFNQFSEVIVQKEDRRANGLAHMLARLCREGLEPALEWGCVPTGAIAIWQEDCMHLQLIE